MYLADLDTTHSITSSPEMLPRQPWQVVPPLLPLPHSPPLSPLLPPLLSLQTPPRHPPLHPINLHTMKSDTREGRHLLYLLLILGGAHVLVNLIRARRRRLARTPKVMTLKVLDPHIQAPPYPLIFEPQHRKTRSSLFLERRVVYYLCWTSATVNPYEGFIDKW